MDPIVVALLREREHYQRRNLPERAAAVTVELQRLGYTEAATVEAPTPPPTAPPETTAIAPPPETATPPRPQPRRSPRAH